MPAIDTERLGLDRGAHLLLRRALRAVATGSSVEVRGQHPDFGPHLRAWARSAGHEVVSLTQAPDGVHAVVRRGRADAARWEGAERAGDPNPQVAGAVLADPPARWGLAARGARVEAGGPEFHFALHRREEVWADEAPRLYAQAAAAQWDPATAVDWTAEFDLPGDVEEAVVQVMTYLVENENAALLVPARFLGQVHPHFREVLQVLAVQVADEARHIEVFTRRALLRHGGMGSSTAGGQASLQTLLEEPDFALASFLLAVLGEGTFLSLLSFLERNGP
ncbi:MAG: sulfurtransferase TusA family protein, partial [Candidatus Dormibacteraeota bacterium]|nr:sulfurtransferase TusA family protein [Candidatus Dormibacteraeota bacterium]